MDVHLDFSSGVSFPRAPFPCTGRGPLFLGIRTMKEGLMSDNTALILLNAEGTKTSKDVELVSDLDGRHIGQISKKAKIPEVFFKEPECGAPGLSGAEVDSETLLGFLSAAAIITKGADVVLSNVKMTYKGTDRLYVEVSNNGIWGIVAIRSSVNPGVEFEEMMSLQRAISIVKRAALRHSRILVGVLRGLISIGPVMIPLNGRIVDFPLKPELRNWETRATVPATYFREILARVIPAQSTDIAEENLRGVLFDYDICEMDGSTRVVCTAIATDGVRMHMLKLPEMMVDSTRCNKIPPSIVLPGRYFSYLSAVANRRWTGLEFSEGQVLARGEDYIAISKSIMRGNSRCNVESWRDIDVEYDGYWAADKFDLEQAVNDATEVSGGEGIRLKIDSIDSSLEVLVSSNTEHFSSIVPIKRLGGPPAVNVFVNGSYLSAAISSCRGGLVRLGFSDDIETQKSSAISIRGEDELFRASLMPVAGE